MQRKAEKTRGNDSAFFPRAQRVSARARGRPDSVVDLVVYMLCFHCSLPLQSDWSVRT